MTVRMLAGLLLALPFAVRAEVVRLTLDNGESVVCTPDHRFMLRDGSYRQADALQAGDALMQTGYPVLS